MFNKSFSNEAVEIAVKYIRLFDDNPDALFDLHEPQKIFQSWPNLQHENDFRKVYNNELSFDVRLSFGLGVISAITQNFFDGKTKHMATKGTFLTETVFVQKPKKSLNGREFVNVRV